MRILLATNACYMPTRGGSTRSNRIWLERFAAHGHECEVIAPVAETMSDFKLRQFNQEARAQGIPERVSWDESSGGVTVWNGVSVHQVLDRRRMVEHLERRIVDFEPDWVLISSEDLGQALLRAAVRISSERTIYLAHTPQLFPFGPASLLPNAAGAEAVVAAAEVIVIGEYTRQYFESFLHRSPLIAHPPVYGSGPFRDYGARNSGFVTTINPCAVKGISIFLSVASRCQEFEFAALPGWGTTSRDLENLRAVGACIMTPCQEIDEVFAQTRILLVPSLWPEGFGLVAVEAMLRGIPVLASNLGGLPEASLDTGYVFPVRQIEKYLPAFDEHLLPIPEVPNQDIEPWRSAVCHLISDPQLYEAASRKAREAAHVFLNNLNPDKLERVLTEMLGRQPTDRRAMKSQIRR